MPRWQPCHGWAACISVQVAGSGLTAGQPSWIIDIFGRRGTHQRGHRGADVRWDRPEEPVTCLASPASAAGGSTDGMLIAESWV